MNLFAPIADQSGPAEDYLRADHFRREPELSSFAVRRSYHKDNRTRIAGVLAVVAVHLLAGALYYFGKPVFTQSAAEKPFVIVQLKQEIVKPPPPDLPKPDFKPPPVYVPVPIIPILELPPPPKTNAITIPPAPPQPTPVTAPIAQKAPAEMSSDERAAYLGALLKHLNAHKRYPERARLRHERGVVSVSFKIDRNGHVLTVSLVKSSGSESLDTESIAAVKRADPLPRIPASFERDSLELVVPIEFVLR